eukprot:2154010-Rhodomonas_salina.4
MPFSLFWSSSDPPSCSPPSFALRRLPLSCSSSLRSASARAGAAAGSALVSLLATAHRPPQRQRHPTRHDPTRPDPTRHDTRARTHTPSLTKHKHSLANTPTLAHSHNTLRRVCV